MNALSMGLYRLLGIQRQKYAKMMAMKLKVMETRKEETTWWALAQNPGFRSGDL